MVTKYFGKFPIAVFTLALLTGAYAFAGGDSSSGGGAMVCRDTQGKIISAELLDLWEVQLIENGAQVNRTQVPVDEQLEQAYAKVKRFFGQAYSDQLRKKVEQIRFAIREVPNAVEINPPSDAFNDMVQRGCKLEGVARFSDRKNILFVNPEILSAMSATDQAALWVHEAIYHARRNDDYVEQISYPLFSNDLYFIKRELKKVEDSNSLASREFVGRIFSTYEWAFQPSIDNSSGELEYLHCVSLMTNGGDVYYFQFDHSGKPLVTLSVDRDLAKLQRIQKHNGFPLDMFLEFIDRPLSKQDYLYAEKMIAKWTKSQVAFPGRHVLRSEFGNVLELTEDRGIQVGLGYSVYTDLEDPELIPLLKNRTINQKSGPWYNRENHILFNPKARPICERLNTRDNPLPW